MNAPRLAALALAMVLSACGSADQAGRRPPQSPAVSQSPSLSPSPSPTPVRITLAFGGDVHFMGRTRRLLDDPPTAIGPFAEHLRAADFAMVNLESAITRRGEPEPKRYHFRAPETAYDALHAAGIDVVSIANNHTLDYGQVGLDDTLESARAAGMAVVGAGRDVTEAYEPYQTTVKGVRIGVVALSQVYELAGEWKATATRPGIAMAFDKDRSVAAVKKARVGSDLVIVYLHWGNEGSYCPNKLQKDTAALLARNGADVIVGTHAHMPQGDGFIGDTYVHYGLGNFLWYGPSKSTDSGLLTVTVTGGKVTNRSFTPAVISGTGQAKPVSGRELAAMQQRLARANRCAALAQAPS